MRKPQQKLQRKPLAPLLAILVLLPTLAQAHGPSYRGHVRVHPRSSVHFGLSMGSGFYSPGYYSPHWYGPSVTYGVPIYTPPVVVQQAPPVYIEQQPAMTADANASNYWYYCAPTKSYYPYVSSCKEAWQRVPPVPPLESSPLESSPIGTQP